jgi:hypothetical protein
MIPRPETKGGFRLQTDTNQPNLPWRTIMNAFVVISVAVLALVVVGVWWYSRQPVGATIKTFNIVQSLEGAKSATVELQPGAAQLHLRAGTQNGKLVEGRAESLTGIETLEPSANRRGDTLAYRLESKHPLAVSEPVRWPIWDLRLDARVPMKFRLVNGIPESDVDLRGLRVTDLDVDATVGRLTLTLPDQGQVQAKVKGGSSRTTIRVPTSTDVRIQARRFGVGYIEVFGETWRNNGDMTTPGFERATNRVDLEVIGGNSRLVIERAP